MDYKDIDDKLITQPGLTHTQNQTHSDKHHQKPGASSILLVGVYLFFSMLLLLFTDCSQDKQDPLLLMYKNPAWV